MEKTRARRLKVIVWLPLPLSLLVAALAIALVAWGRGADTHVAADDPHASLNFHIEAGIDGGDADTLPDSVVCSTAGNTLGDKDSCKFAEGQQFTVVLRVNATTASPPGGDFTPPITGADGKVTYSGVTTGDLKTTGFIPTGCVNTTRIHYVGAVSFLCAIGGSTTDIGVASGGGLFSQLFNCGASGPVAIAHGSAYTDLTDDLLAAHTEAASGNNGDVLNITCTTPTSTATLSPTATGTATRTATATGTATATATVTPPPSELTDVIVTKADSPDPVDNNGVITYTLQVRNIGLQTATGVKVIDTLPAGVVFVSASSAGVNCSESAGVVTCQIKSDMGPNGKVTIVIKVRAPIPETDILIKNQVRVQAANEPFVNTANNNDTEETVVLAPRADVTLQKTGQPSFVSGGEAITYKLLVGNIGPLKAAKVTIRDELPAGAIFKSASTGCAYDGGTGVVTCALGSLQPAATASVQIVINAPAVTRDTLIKNLARVSANNELFSQQGNNLDIEKTAVLAPPPVLNITKSGPPAVFRVRFYTYSVTVTNKGAGDAFGVLVTDTLPKYILNGRPQRVTFVDATFNPPDPDNSCAQVPSTNLVQCVIDELLAGQQVKISLNVRAPTALTKVVLKNEVTVVDPDEPSVGDSDSAVTAVQPCFDVSGDKRVSAIDVIIVVRAHTTANVLADFNGDGTVSSVDVVLVVRNHKVPCVLP